MPTRCSKLRGPRRCATSVCRRSGAGTFLGPLAWVRTRQARWWMVPIGPTTSATSSSSTAAAFRPAALVIESRVESDDRVVLDQHMVRPGLRQLTRRESHHDQATFERDAFGGTVEHVTSDRVIDDIGSMAFGEVLHRLDEVICLVVDRVVCAELLAQTHLLRRAGGRDHNRSGGLTKLDGGAAHAAGAGMNQQ